MKTFRIAHFDDSLEDLQSVKTDFKIKNLEYQSNKKQIKLIQIQFTDYLKLVKEIENGNKFDIVIVDIFDDFKKTKIGEHILRAIKAEGGKIPVIIFTKGHFKGQLVDDNYSDEYDFLLGEVINKSEKRKLIDRIESYVMNNIDIQYVIDEDDVFLQAEIMAIGKSNLNKILFTIGSKIDFDSLFQIESMSAGFSGASVFKLIYDSKASILKVSRDKKGLKDEIEKAKKYYSDFPSTLTYLINYDEYGNHGDEVIAFLLKEVKDGETLFDWLKRENDKSKIEKLLNNLYLSSNKLAAHYKTNRNNNEHVKFKRIFKTFDNSIKYSMVKKAINDLDPIIEKNSDFEFDKHDILTLIKNNKYKAIDVEEITKTKNTVLCHGDFHSKNILVQGESPIIIDTGGLGYDYWTSDISRLIVHLYIEGIDAEKYDFFDLDKISPNLKIAKKIINLETIDFDGLNDSYIFAINWLIRHVAAIYDDLFSKWELQLGLLKEFLQVSYRTRLPASKRSLALLAAYQCLIAANNEIKDTKE